MEEGLKPEILYKVNGPDQIPSFRLTTSEEQLAPTLTDSYPASLNTSEVPQDWRKALIL